MPNFAPPVLFEVPKLEASILAFPHENVQFTRAWAFSYFWRKYTKSKSMLLHIESCHSYGPNCFYSVDFATRICILKTPPFSTLDLLSRTSKWSFKLDFSMKCDQCVFSWPKSTTSQRILEGLACDTGPSKMFAHFRPVCNPFWWAINEKTSMLSSSRIHLKLSTCPFVWKPLPETRLTCFGSCHCNAKASQSSFCHLVAEDPGGMGRSRTTPTCLVCCLMLLVLSNLLGIFLYKRLQPRSSLAQKTKNEMKQQHLLKLQDLVKLPCCHLPKSR